jgi:para-aminobenzoate synthetase component I
MRHRVLTTVYRRWIDPQQAFCALYRDAENAFWLDSGRNAAAGRSYLGASSRVVLPGAGASALDFLRGELDAGAPDPTPDAGFALGWVGWLGYERRRETMAIPVDHAERYPEAAFLYADRVVVFDHAERTVTLLALGESWAGPLNTWREETMSRLDGLGPPSAAPQRSAAPSPRSTSEVHWAHSDADYLDLIQRCQEHIARGEAYQLCLTNQAQLDVHPDPLDTYLALRAASASHHGGFVRVGEVALLSTSPEQFLTVTADGEVVSKPIKGTRARGASAEADARLRRELLASEKERAENLMIVDLMRNDLARVCEVGSVGVPSLFAVESYAHVHQLVSTVSGRLAVGRTGLDAVAACFPAGSMTGAPKRRATELLDELEGRPRGVYSGVFGYFGLDGRIELAMVIRSIMLDPRGATVGSGGGITAASIPGEELEEMKLKAAALLAVLGAER